MKLQAAGGERRHGEHGDGAYRHRPGDFGKPTPGRIPRNVLDISTTCASQRQYKRRARELGLPAHSASFPLRLSSFLIEFLSAPGDLVVDPFGGSGTVGVSAEKLGRRWMLVEMMAEYVRGSAERFREYPGFWMSDELDFLVNE